MTPIVILAGGMSSRMGRDKLKLEFRGKTLLEDAVSRFASVFREVFVSVAAIGVYPHLTVPQICDIVPGRGPLSGLHAALTFLNQGVFITAADLPFADPEYAKKIVEFSNGYEACIIRRETGRTEPLFAYYSDSVLPVCESLLHAGNNKMANLLRQVKTLEIEERELCPSGFGNMLMNVNYPADYERIRKLDT